MKRSELDKALGSAHEKLARAAYYLNEQMTLKRYSRETTELSRKLASEALAGLEALLELGRPRAGG